MPIYEYQCQACSHRIEKLQKLSDEPLKVCPDCNKPELKKMISAVAFRLKGSGWYETDFKTGDKKNVSTSDNASGASGDASKSSDSSSKNSGDSSKGSSGGDSSKSTDSGSSKKSSSSSSSN